MKSTFTKILLLTMLAFSSINANAQLATGSIAPNFTFTDMNGNSHTLYDYLDQGYTVYLDFFATWCSPCWAYHNAHNFKTLYETHGPSGMTGVSASTTNDVMVFSIDGDGATTDADMVGTGSNTLGNWTSGIPYPMINVPSSQANAFAQSYGIAYWPTIYKVCRDRVIEEVGQLSATNLYATEASCPQTAPSASADAKSNSVIEPFFACGTINATVTIQNYSLTPLTSANIEVLDGSSVIATQPWTGNLAPYGIAQVPVSFTSNNNSGFTYRVVATGDVNAANNSVTGGDLTQYLASNVAASPLTADFNSTLPASSSIGGPDAVEMMGWISDARIGNVSSYVGPNSVNSGALTICYPCVDPGGNGVFTFGNFNTNGMTVTLDMDYAKAGINGTENDLLALVHSSDCGSTWAEFWSKSGTDLNTGPANSTQAFRPTNASHWAHVSATYTGTSDNDVIAVRAVSQGGNYGWIENVNLFVGPSGVESLSGKVNLSLFPNPAENVLNLQIENLEKQDFTVTITNVFGQVMAASDLDANATTETFDISNLAGGQYILTITNKEGSKLAKPFMVK